MREHYNLVFLYRFERGTFIDFSIDTLYFAAPCAFHRFFKESLTRGPALSTLFRSLRSLAITSPFIYYKDSKNAEYDHATSNQIVPLFCLFRQTCNMKHLTFVFDSALNQYLTDSILPDLQKRRRLCTSDIFHEEWLSRLEVKSAVKSEYL